MHRLAGRLVILILFALAGPALAEDPWMTLPPTPTLPQATQSGLAEVNGIKVWYAEFGPADGKPVILLHGGLGNSDYFGLQVPALAQKYRVIVMDSRGHGRSARDARPYGYDLMAEDVIGLLDFLKIQKAAVIGWSDGAILGLDIAIHHPGRLTKLFAFAANSNTAGVADISASKVFNAYIERTGGEYEKLSPTPKDFQGFLDQIGKMWATQPDFTDAQLAAITTPTWIVDGDRDEAIKRENTEYMASHIPGAGLLILPQVSHFAFLQDPEGFNAAVLHFLDHAPETK
jgi:pimeloyl-ACP methyl ester carboxylesterase